MIKTCIGCGSILQCEDSNNIGYVNEKVYEKSQYCERCFKLKNYGEINAILDKNDTEKIIYDLDKNKKNVVYFVDVLNLVSSSFKFLKYFNKNPYVLITKKDLLPKSVTDRKIITYFKNNFDIKSDIMCVSSNKKYNIDLFVKQMKKKNIKEVYFIGLTNSGKSTFINALLCSVGLNPLVTTSNIPNTTSDYIKIKINDDLTVIDTPGFILENSIYKYLSVNDINRITPRNRIKVKTYQMKPGLGIVVDKFLRIDYLEGKQNSFSFYMNDNLDYKKVNIKNKSLAVLPRKCMEIPSNTDIVISGLGFAKIVNACKIEIYSLDEELIYIRKKMI